MLCSNCGKDIPYTGKVCPYCNAEKAGDRKRHDEVAAFGFVGVAIGGVPGYLIGGLPAAMAYGMITGVVAVAAGAVWIAIRGNEE